MGRWGLAKRCRDRHREERPPQSAQDLKEQTGRGLSPPVPGSSDHRGGQQAGTASGCIAHQLRAERVATLCPGSSAVTWSTVDAGSWVEAGPQSFQHLPSPPPPHPRPSTEEASRAALPASL